MIYLEVGDYEKGIGGIVELVMRARRGEVQELGKGKGARL